MYYTDIPDEPETLSLHSRVPSIKSANGSWVLDVRSQGHQKTKTKLVEKGNAKAPPGVCSDKSAPLQAQQAIKKASTSPRTIMPSACARGREISGWVLREAKANVYLCTVHVHKVPNLTVGR